MSNSLKIELTRDIPAIHTASDDVYIQIPDIKKEDMIPWSMKDDYFYPLCLDCQSNQMTLLFQLAAGGIHTHYHCGQTFAYTFQGKWRYTEEGSKIMVPGTFILEYPGVTHTVEVISEEPVLMVANMRSGFLFVDRSPSEITEPGEHPKITMYQDPYYFYYRAKQYYEEEGKDFSQIEMVTTLGTAIRPPHTASDRDASRPKLKTAGA
ncbi:hypothetical protein [Roseibium sp. RKSG952]|uniref:cupin domain-containing protein n=1 Tax=Roseibium sp. RKSG952 TaxID=2529384 RepID=UPI0012BC7537|nr:hypothetical protein [Roseibium sp. RKSG952]MTH96096.1 hypothetical protein [Roseibium sp. RKSG952]